MTSTADYNFQISVNAGTDAKVSYKNSFSGHLTGTITDKSLSVQNGILKLIESYIHSLGLMSFNIGTTPITSVPTISGYTIQTDDIITYFLEENVYFIFRSNNLIIITNDSINDTYIGPGTKVFVYKTNVFNITITSYGNFTITRGKDTLVFNLGSNITFNGTTIPEEILSNGIKDYCFDPFSSVSILVIPDPVPESIDTITCQLGFFYNNGAQLDYSLITNYILGKYTFMSYHRKLIINFIRGFYDTFKSSIVHVLESDTLDFNSDKIVDSINIKLRIKDEPEPIGTTGSISGVSAYQLWLMDGNTGSLTDFLVSLIGSPGVTGPTGAQGPSVEPNITEPVTIVDQTMGYILDINNTETSGGGNGVIIRATDNSGDSALKIVNATSTRDIFELESNGRMIIGKTYSQTVADNGICYGVENQSSTAHIKDFNTQSGTYRIGGTDLKNVAQTLTNKTITDTTNIVTANGLRSTTTTIDIASSAAPSAGQVLTATGSSAATWQNYQPPYCNIIALSNNITTTSTSFIVIDGMSMIPPAGTYSVILTVCVNMTFQNRTLTVQIFKDTFSQGAESIFVAKNTEDTNTSVCIAKITVNGSESINGRWKVESNTGNIYGRSMMITAVKP